MEGLGPHSREFGVEVVLQLMEDLVHSPVPLRDMRRAYESLFASRRGNRRSGFDIVSLLLFNRQRGAAFRAPVITSSFSPGSSTAQSSGTTAAAAPALK
jgi:hypothetical protein